MKKHFITAVVVTLVFALVVTTACTKPVELAEFQVSSLTITPNEVVVEEAFTVKVNVENIGGVDGTYTVTLKIDGKMADTKEVSVGAGTVKGVSFTYRLGTAGIHTIELDGLNATVTVLKPAEFEISSLEVTPALVLPRQEATVKADVANVGSVESTLTTNLAVNGIETDTRRLTLAPGATGIVSFPIIRDLPGNYELSVNGQSTNLTIAEVETYSSDQYLYSISYPSGWTLREQSAEMVVMGKLGIGGITVAVETVPVDMSLEEYYLISIDNASQSLAGFELLSKSEIQEDGNVVGYKITYEYVQEGINLASKTLIMKKGRLGFGVSSNIRKAVYEINAPLLDACLESFKAPIVAVGSYTNTTHGFFINLPEGWDGLETGEQMPLLRIQSPVEGPLVYVFVYLSRIYEDTIARDYALNTAALWSAEPDYKILAQEEVTLGESTQGYEVIFTYKENGYHIKRKLVSVIRGTQAFLVMPYTLASTYDNTRSTIDQLTDSFTLLEPKPFGVSKQTSYFRWQGEIVTLDPALSESGAGGIISAIFSGLVRIDKNLEVVPDIAKRWEVSADGKTYTFHLRGGVKFHDGKLVTAGDFKYSWERACDPKTNSKKARTYLGDIVGAKEMLAGEATELNGVRIIDDLTLEVTIDGPKPYFLGKLTYATAYVVDRANVAQGMKWTDAPNGTGIFKLKEWKKDELLVLERNDDYYLEPTKLENVVFQIFTGRPMMMYERGEIDTTNVDLSNLERVLDPVDPLNKELLTKANISIGYLGFNVNMPPFDDPKVRRAFALALDIDKIVEVSLKGNAERGIGFIPPGMPGYNEELEPLPFDPEQARRLIGESMYGSVDNLPPIVLYNVYGLGAAEEAVIGMLQANLGVTVEAQIIEELEEWYERSHNREFQLFISGWGADYIDPQNFLEVLFHSQSDDNPFAYSNLEVDTALEGAAVEQDERARLKMYQDIERLILGELPAVPLYHSWKNNVLVKPYIKGYYLYPIGINFWSEISIEPH